MGKFDQNRLPEGTQIIAEMDMKPVIAAINAADDVPDQAIQRGVCLAMSLKMGRERRPKPRFLGHPHSGRDPERHQVAPA